FPAIVPPELIRRRGGEEEPGVEALGHALRGNPVRVGDELVQRQPELVLGEHVEEGRLALAERHTIGRLDLAGPLGIDQDTRALLAGQEDAALLKRLADRGHAEAERAWVAALPAAMELTPRHDLLVALIDAAAGKHQSARVELDLMMADHHE